MRFRRFIRQKSSRERPRPSSISDLQYSVNPSSVFIICLQTFPTILLVHRINCNNNQVESSPTSSVPSKSSVSSTDTSPSGRPESWRPSDSGGRQTESDSSSGGELTSHELNLATISGVSLPSLAILDQSCSSLPSQSAASSGSSQEQVSNDTPILLESAKKSAIGCLTYKGRLSPVQRFEIIFLAGFWLPRVVGSNPSLATQWKVCLLLSKLHGHQTTKRKGP